MTDQVEHVDLALDDDELARVLGTDTEVLARERAGFDLVHKAAAGIRAARLHRGLTQKQLAEKLGVTVGRVSQYETGDLRHAPSLRVLAEIAHVLGMSVGVFLVPDEAFLAASQSAALTAGAVVETGSREFDAAMDRILEIHPEARDEPLPASAKVAASGRK
jgi:transcriptional regulator with XRE-family HTH domain